jgi:hypothetical protein
MRQAKESDLRIKPMLAGFAFLALGGLLVAAPAAFAAGGGYGPTTPGQGGSGSFGSVVGSKVICAAGGTLTGAVDGVDVVVTVPSGSFTACDQVEIAPSALTSGGMNAALKAMGFANFTAVTGVGIDVVNPNGSAAGAFQTPISVAFSGSALGVSGEEVLEMTGSTSARVLPSTLASGSISASLSSDPDLMVINPLGASTPSVVPGATIQATGLPFRGEEMVAVALALFGIALLSAVALRRRRDSSARSAN